MAPSSLVELLAPDAAHYVRRWAQEMRVTEGEIVTRLVRQSALMVRARRGFSALEEVGDALAPHVPYGRMREFVLAAINSRPGPWRLQEIRAHVFDRHYYQIKPKTLSSLLNTLRKAGDVTSGGFGVVSRVEP